MTEQPATSKKRKRRRKPRSTSRIERGAILGDVQEMLFSGKYPGEIKREVSRKYKLSPRSIEGYLRRAREAKLEATGRPVEEHRSDSFAFYRSVVADPKASARDKIRAQQSIDRLLGLCMPVKLDSSGVLVNTTPEELSRMNDEDLQRFYSSLAGLGRDGNPGQAKS